jgi:hypothetical protein
VDVARRLSSHRSSCITAVQVIKALPLEKKLLKIIKSRQGRERWQNSWLQAMATSLSRRDEDRSIGGSGQRGKWTMDNIQDSVRQ